MKFFRLYVIVVAPKYDKIHLKTYIVCCVCCVCCSIKDTYIIMGPISNISNNLMNWLFLPDVATHPDINPTVITRYNTSFSLSLILLYFFNCIDLDIIFLLKFCK